jgi:hypothetical protein
MLVASSSAPGWIALGISGTTLLWTMFWSVWQQRQSTRPRLAARTAITFPIIPNAEVLPHIQVEAANTGAVPVRITGVMVHVKGIDGSLAITSWKWQSPEPLPTTLEPGSGHWQAFYETADLKDALDKHYGERSTWRVRARITTSGDRRFMSTARKRTWRRPWKQKWTKVVRL